MTFRPLTNAAISDQELNDLFVAIESNKQIKVVINRCYGGFSLTDDAIKRIMEIDPTAATKDTQYGHEPYFERHNLALVEVVEAANFVNSDESQLGISVIPRFMKNYYTIAEYDGKETVKVNYDEFITDTIRKIASPYHGADRNPSMTADKLYTRMLAINYIVNIKLNSNLNIS